MKNSSVQSIRVISYNIHKGLSPLGRKKTLDSIKKLLNKFSPDFVMLQEVVGEGRQAPIDYESQFEKLADQHWPNFAYGKNAVYDNGHHGNCILSKPPILSWSNLDISTNAFESRGLLFAETKFPGSNQNLGLLCTHLNLLGRDREKQIHKITDFINNKIDKSMPLILCGDFNDWKQSITKTLTENCGLKECFLEKNGKHAKTFPSLVPLLKLDRVYYRGLSAVSAKTLKLFPNLQSDHLPLLAELEIKI